MRFCYLNHPRVVHLFKVKEVFSPKRIIFKSPIYLFVCWLHNRDGHLFVLGLSPFALGLLALLCSADFLMSKRGLVCLVVS